MIQTENNSDSAPHKGAGSSKVPCIFQLPVATRSFNLVSSSLMLSSSLGTLRNSYIKFTVQVKPVTGLVSLFLFFLSL